ncbi:MAG: methylenetetrahydrofolate reductase [Deltaproteobacteria bacterium]|nr:methylenetetrahydrofolate reductase [Deltaproteobacteria bacterium]
MIAETRLQQTLAQGQFAITCEFTPPRGIELNRLFRIADLLKGKVDAVNVNDNPNSNVRMSSLICSRLLLERGLEPIFEQSMRDRNRLALQSDLLGAAAVGIQNVLCLTGDHPFKGDHPEANKVFDLDSTQWIAAVKRIRDQGILLNGKKITGRPKFFIGGVANPFMKTLDLHIIRLQNKIAAGADFIQTQPVFDTEAFQRWMNRVEEAGLIDQVPIITGVAALKSLQLAEYLRDRVSGFNIPDPIINRLKSMPEDQQPSEGLRICVEQIKALQQIKGVKGVHIISIGNEEKIPDIIEQSGLPLRLMK